MVDDEQEWRDELILFFTKRKIQVEAPESVARMWEVLRSFGSDLKYITLDNKLGGFPDVGDGHTSSGGEMCPWIRGLALNARIIAIHTGNPGDVQADDFISKANFDVRELERRFKFC